MIELVAGLVLLWSLYIKASGFHIERIERAEKTSSWIVGISLLLIAVYIVLTAFEKLQSHAGAESSPIGISLAIVSAFLMQYLARAKINVGQKIGSHALIADGACSLVCS